MERILDMQETLPIHTLTKWRRIIFKELLIFTGGLIAGAIGASYLAGVNEGRREAFAESNGRSTTEEREPVTPNNTEPETA